jgi:hypothetical protein
MQPFPKKDNTPDFSNPLIRQAFVQNTENSKELMQKELDVNQAEQLLLKKRIALMKSYANDLPSWDPQYAMLLAQVQMDQIEIDELKVRQALLAQQLTSYKLN